jgi:hypothetical protein
MKCTGILCQLNVDIVFALLIGQKKQELEIKQRQRVYTQIDLPREQQSIDFTLAV